MTENEKNKKLNEAEYLCPACGKPVENNRCRLCGAEKELNILSGNIIWKRAGKVIAAFQDAKEAYIKMAERYGLPKETWPKEFQD